MGGRAKRITLSATHRVEGPEARTPQSTVSARIGLRGKANAGSGWSRAGAAGVWASRRVGREGAVKLSDSSPHRAGSGSRKSDRGRRGAGARSPAQAERDAGARRDRAGGRAVLTPLAEGSAAARGRGCGRRVRTPGPPPVGRAPRRGYESAAG